MTAGCRSRYSWLTVSLPVIPSVQHWDLNEMGYVETMFGHQSEINAIDSWRKERVVTGGRDRTVSLETTFCWYAFAIDTKNGADRAPLC